MTTEQASTWTHTVRNRGCWFLLLTVLFAVSYCQAPLYFSNQNQYFLHALAQSGFGHLDNDWLANTKDPTPIFTFVMTCTYRYLHPYFFHVYYALLQGLYFLSLLGLFAHVVGKDMAQQYRWGFLTVCLLLHSGLARMASTRLFGVDYPWYFQAGVAGQYVLGPMLQPSVFGVLLLVSVWAFVEQKPRWAVALAVLGATIHTTYVLSAAMLTMAYLVALIAQRQVRQALLTGCLALFLVLPIVIYNVLTFRPSSAEAFRQAQHILVHVRIPHHCLPRLWCDLIALLQIFWIVWAIWLARKTPLFWVLAISFTLAAAGTVLQIGTDHNTLALLFPWRISVILVPLATTVVLAHGFTLLASRSFTTKRFSPRIGRMMCFGIITLVVLGGLSISVFRLAFQTRDQELAMMDFVRANVSPEDTYLIPIRVPDLENTVRGSAKSDFRPLKSLEDNQQFIPLNLQRFRLRTGAPLFVDFKSIPYWDRDVVQWEQRLRLTQSWYEDIRQGQAQRILNQLNEHNISHVIVRADQTLPSHAFEQIYEDSQYRIYHRRKQKR